MYEIKFQDISTFKKVFPNLTNSMNLTGKQTYKASAQQIWDILMDTEQLAKITPGVSKLERISEDQYNAISEIKIGPGSKELLKATFFWKTKRNPPDLHFG